MEALAVIDAQFWRGRRVFLTGHTGFKGGWLALWLQNLGAQVHGFALAPATQPNLYTEACVGAAMASEYIDDIRDAAALQRALQAVRPEVVFHLAAQSLVRPSYAQPTQTYATNVMGTVNLLEAVRATPSVRAVLNVTSDKCYENRERIWGYRETDALGGHDPYSSSKACAEIVTAAYRHSFLDAGKIGVASARAGNVIGGGDWAMDRLVPDCLRAIDAGLPIAIRSPHAVRPWQHVLEPLSGYLMLAERLHAQPAQFGEAWNFGPPEQDSWTVQRVVEGLSREAPGSAWQADLSPQPHEAGQLRLDSAKARALLHWRPKWDVPTALDLTWQWHCSWRAGSDMRGVCSTQIDMHHRAAKGR